MVMMWVIVGWPNKGTQPKVRLSKNKRVTAASSSHTRNQDESDVDDREAGCKERRVEVSLENRRFPCTSCSCLLCGGKSQAATPPRGGQPHRGATTMAWDNENSQSLS
jgi:hypothetical protein